VSGAKLWTEDFAVDSFQLALGEAEVCVEMFVSIGLCEVWLEA